MTPGQVIREARRRRGLTQEVAAGLAAIHPAYWSDLECDSNSPSIATMEKVAAGLGMRFAYGLVDPRDELDQQPQYRGH